MPKQFSRRTPSRRIFTKEDIKRIKKNAYLDIGEGVRDKRRSRMPPARKSMTAAQIAAVLKKAERRYPVKIPRPDMHEPVRVENLVFEKGGTFGSFRFTTSVDCWAIVGAVDSGELHAEPNSKTGWDFSTAPEYLNLDGILGPAGKDHELALVDLMPDRTYHFMIKLIPKDKSKPFLWEPSVGSFSTSRRHALIRVDKVWMIDAADFGGTGEMFFSSQVGFPGFFFHEPGNSLDHDEYPSNRTAVEVSSGKWVNTNLRMFAAHVSDGVELAFSVIEQDFGSIWPSSLDTHGTGGYPADTYFGVFDHGDLEANSRSWRIRLDGGTYMSPGSSLAQREVYITGFAYHVAPKEDVTDLEYDIHGSIQVFYDFQFNFG